MLPQRKRDVVKDAQVSKQRAELKQHAHFPAHGIKLRMRHAVNRAVLHPDFSAIRF